MAIDLTANTTLNLTVSQTLLHTALSTALAWKKDLEARGPTARHAIGPVPCEASPGPFVRPC